MFPPERQWRTPQQSCGPSSRRARCSRPGLGAWAPVRLVMSAPCCWFRRSAVPRNSGQGVPLSQQIQRPGPHTLVPQPLESVGHHSPATLTSPPCFPPHTLRNHGPPRGVASSGWVRRPQHLRANLLLRRLSPSASRDVRAGPLGLDCPLTRPEWSFSPRSVLASSLAPSVLSVAHPAPWPLWPLHGHQPVLVSCSGVPSRPGGRGHPLWDSGPWT